MNFAAVNGLTIHFEDKGPRAGTPLIFVNSLGTDLRIWDEVVERLSLAHRCVSFDKRGHGLSDSPPGPYTLEQQTDDVLALADHLGITQFVLAGVSIGGLIALGVASRHSDRVAALILCDTAARLGTAKSWAERIEMVQNLGMPSIADAIMDRWFSPTFRADRPAELAGWRNMFLRADPLGYTASCATLRDTDLTTEAGSIAMPVLVVAGSADASTPPDLVEETARLIPSARFKVIEGAGHIPSIEQPGQLSDMIEAFVKEAIDV